MEVQVRLIKTFKDLESAVQKKDLLMRAMPRIKEISEDPQSRVADLHEAEKGYRTDLDIHQSTV